MAMKTTTPDWFGALFRELATALQPRRLPPDALAVYYGTLAQLGEDKLRAAALTLKRRQFFPTTGEWYAAAMNTRAQASPPVAARCARCEGRGLIVVRYHTGEPFDLAICDCPRAQPFRIGGPELVAQFVTTPLGGRIRMTDENRIGYVEDFAD